MYTRRFWKDAFERVVSTAAQAAIGVIVAGSIVGLATQAGVIAVVSAAVLSLLKALVANKATSDSVSPASLVRDQ